VRDARGTSLAPSDAARDLRGSIERDAIRLLLALAEGTRALKKVMLAVEGRQMPALEIRGGAPLTLIFDPANALIARLRYALDTPQGPRTAEEIFSDYRDVGGLKVAFRAVLQREGAPRVERIVKSFEYNIPLDPALFERSL
jgi:hypothetical protein